MSTRKETEEEGEERLEEGTMSFLDHLDELRKRLIRCALFVGAAFVVSWLISGYIYKFLEVPVRAAMIEAKSKGVYKGLENVAVGKLWDFIGSEVDFTFPTDAKIANGLIHQGTTIRVLVNKADDGAIELVTTAPWAIDVNTVVKEGALVPRELYQPSNIYLNEENKLVVGTVQGAFNLYIKVAFYAAIFFSVPFLLIQAWGFISPGLYAHEKRYATPVIAMASGFFLLGCAFAYLVAFPRAASFLLGVAAEGNLRTLVTADDYFDLIILIMLGLGVVFEIPTITFFTSRLGLVTPGLLLKIWRYAIIVIFIVAAVLSPTTDIPNLLVFALPMILLYFGSVGIAWIFYRKRQSEQEYKALARKEA